jgi:hypothetical protein
MHPEALARGHDLGCRLVTCVSPWVGMYELDAAHELPHEVAHGQSAAREAFSVVRQAARVGLAAEEQPVAGDHVANGGGTVTHSHGPSIVCP